MPKSVFYIFACVCLGAAFAACNSGGGGVTPTPGPSVSATPNPKISSAVIDVTILGTPAPNIPVQESTPASQTSARPGTVIETLHTGKLGAVKFTGLKPGATYCWAAILGPNVTSYACAPWNDWQFSHISIGT